MIKSFIPVASLVLLFSSAATAAIKSNTIPYQDGDVQLQGHLAWDDSAEGKRPGVLVVHEWWGLNDYARQRAEQLAELGYVAFAVDMYGKGKVTEHPKQAGAWARMISNNSEAWRKRAQAGLNILRQVEWVDQDKLAAIGYCFGGATVMQLAYAGADLDGVVSFHGSLPVFEQQGTEEIKAKILVCHGVADGFIPAERIAAFQAALEDADADWQMIYYAGARHGFTNPGADKFGIDGVKYNKNADKRSWRHMQDFFAELFGK